MTPELWIPWVAGATAALALGFGFAAATAGLQGQLGVLRRRPTKKGASRRKYPVGSPGVLPADGLPFPSHPHGHGASGGLGPAAGSVPPWADPLLTRAALLGRWWSDRYGPLPDQQRAALEQSDMAGLLSQEEWVGVQLAWSLLAGGFAAVAALAITGSLFTAVFIGLCAALLGWRAAAGVLNRRKVSYQRGLLAALPGVAEHLLMATSGGMNVRQALVLSVRTGDTELHALLGAVVDGLGAGKSLDEAVAGVLTRVEPGPVRLVLSGLVDAERLGTRYADTLRDQTSLARDLGRQEMERRLNLVPVKLMMVTMFFMLPPILIVIVLPNLLTVLRSNW